MADGIQLVLVRHGETEWTEKGLLHGRLDSPLSATGRLHARQAGVQLSGQHFDALFSSPRGRALETAAFIGQETGLAPEPLEGLQEMDYGWLEGRPLDYVDPDGTGAFLLRPLVRLAMAATGERPGQMAKRIANAIDTLCEEYTGGRLLLVTHWGVLSMIQAQLLNGHHRSWRSNGPWAACGISELRHRDGNWQAVYLNRHDHLDVDG